MISQLQSHRQK